MRSVMLALLLALSASLGGVPAATENPPVVAECTFTNPAYSGKCVVSEKGPADATPQQTCEAILTCLNDTRCAAKSYCNATSIRGGWKLEEAKAKP